MLLQQPQQFLLSLLLQEMGVLVQSSPPTTAVETPGFVFAVDGVDTHGKLREGFLQQTVHTDTGTLGHGLPPYQYSTSTPNQGQLPQEPPRTPSADSQAVAGVQGLDPVSLLVVEEPDH